ncbi:TetR/AcrR family transcriptional regulator [Rhodobacteraceae bacterium F11138]|nr:TetR/AcrR family transcriptional regulator [Rhodobacteraceae bacterium F11138]
MDKTFQTLIGKDEPDNIAATFQPQQPDTTSHLALHPSELFCLAEQLVAHRGKKYAAANLIDTSAQFFDLTARSGFKGIAKRITRKSQYSVWDIQFSGNNGCRIAAVKLSYLSNADDADDLPSDNKVKHAPKTSPPKSENKRDLVAEAACQVIADKGFAGASMREIAAAAGMHVPTMYQYVRSKDEVLELVYNSAILRVRQNAADALNADLEPLDKLMLLIASLVKGNFEMRKEAGVLNRELRSLSHEGRVRVLAHYSGFMKEVADIISNGVSSGEFRDVDAHIVANVIDAICDMWALRPFALSDVKQEDFIEEVSRFVTYGLFRKSDAP